MAVGWRALQRRRQSAPGLSGGIVGRSAEAVLQMLELMAIFACQTFGHSHLAHRAAPAWHDRRFPFTPRIPCCVLDMLAQPAKTLSSFHPSVPLEPEVCLRLLRGPRCQTLGKVWPAPRVCDGTLRGQQAVHFMKQYGANQVVYCSAAASDDEPSTPPAQAPASMSAADPLLLDAACQELAPVRHARLLVRARLLARPPLAQGLEAVFWVVASGWLGKAWQGLRIEELGTLVLHQAAGFAS